MTARDRAPEADGTTALGRDVARLFQPHLTPRLLEAMRAGRLHLNAEMMSKNDQTHGAAVLNESPVFTSGGRGLYIDLAAGTVEGPADRFVRFLGFRETVAFCTEHGLPVDSAIIATGAAARGFMAAVSAARDRMTDSLFHECLAGLEGVDVVPGTVTHAHVLGEVLEGLVIHQYTGGTGSVRPSWPSGIAGRSKMGSLAAGCHKAGKRRRRADWAANRRCSSIPARGERRP